MPSSRLNPHFTMLAAICALAAISVPTVHSAYLPLDIEDASVIASKMPVLASKPNHLASVMRPGPLRSSHHDPEQATHREHHATTHAQSALHPTVTAAQESEQATHHEHHTHTTTHAQRTNLVTSATSHAAAPRASPASPQRTADGGAQSRGKRWGRNIRHTFCETLVLDLLNPLLLFEEIEDALSRTDPQSQGLVQRGPDERAPQVAFDVSHIGLDMHGERDFKQSPVVFSGEHDDGEGGVVSGTQRDQQSDLDGAAKQTWSTSDSTETATATVTLPPGSVALYTASTGVSPAIAELASGNSLGPTQPSSAALPTITASDAGDADANIAAAGPSSWSTYTGCHHPYLIWSLHSIEDAKAAPRGDENRLIPETPPMPISQWIDLLLIEDYRAPAPEVAPERAPTFLEPDDLSPLEEPPFPADPSASQAHELLDSVAAFEVSAVYSALQPRRSQAASVDVCDESGGSDCRELEAAMSCSRRINNNNYTH
ncbi:hypothetical protein FIBSPDRAFT_940760 [Athelia psychrophila]|uniref:Uncharacterized protein n=1 Tax=Athelia psychrophila TaxID=1759441 RepID=A0A167VDA3_9AGAM|nr:hypothetical protein FIBSPDRAFT_940760 [Fibularhizoctonia sp. CBS 109695]